MINGNFETGDKTGWTDWATTTVSADAKRSGNYGLETVFKEENVEWGTDFSGFFQEVDVEANTGYKFSFWMKAKTSGKVGGAKIADITSGDDALEVFTTEATGDWEDITYEFTTGAGTTKLRVTFFPHSGNQYIDDIVLQKKDIEDEPIDEFPNLVQNGGFETGDLVGWDGWANSPVTTGAKRSGTYGMHIKNGGPDDYSPRSQDVTIEPNKEYIFSAWIKSLEIGEGECGKIADISSGDDEVIRLKAKGTGDWEQIIYRFKSGSSMTKIRISFFAVSMDYYIDDIELRETLPESSDTGLVLNGNFETGDLTSWNIDGGSTAVVSTDAAYDGKYGLILQSPEKWKSVRQFINVKPNTWYEFDITFKDLNNQPAYAEVRDAEQTTQIVRLATIPLRSNEPKWSTEKATFFSGDSGRVQIVINHDGNDSSDYPNITYIDNISLYESEEALAENLNMITNYHPGKLRVNSEQNNLIKEGGFEADGSWNTDTFLQDPLLEVVESPKDARSGSKVLRYLASERTDKIKRVFYMDVEPESTYMFSAWIRAEYISESNNGSFTFGVVDADTLDFFTWSSKAESNMGQLNDISTEKQLVTPAFDNDWHLKGVEFKTGNRTRVGIAIYCDNDAVWMDDFVLCKTENSVAYTHPRYSAVISTKYYDGLTGCDPEDNLIEDFDFSATTFWESGTGFGNFVRIFDPKKGYGNSLEYKFNEKTREQYYIRWVDVEPNTNYVFSCDVMVTEDGNGGIGLLDDKIRIPMSFYEIQCDSENYGDDWLRMSTSFNSGVFGKIGFYTYNGGGEMFVDNIRLFESGNAKDVEDDFVEVPDIDEKDPETDGDIPKTSDVTPIGIMVALMVGAMVSIMFARKKKII